MLAMCKLYKLHRIRQLTAIESLLQNFNGTHHGHMTVLSQVKLNSKLTCTASRQMVIYQRDTASS